MRLIALCLLITALGPTTAEAHVSEQGFVLLLPTGVYIVAGVTAVALTVMALFAVTGDGVRALFAVRRMQDKMPQGLADGISLISTLILGFLIYLGIAGPRDPLSNLMPLGFWTVGWICLVSLSAVMGNLWCALNPWTGLYRLLRIHKGWIKLPDHLGMWPATALLVGFAAFLLADIAPDDPARLASFVGVYWTITFVGMLACGPAWLRHVELGHGIFSAFSRMAPLRIRTPAGIGGPGWQVVEGKSVTGAGVFALTLLAVGSFDGINETFWWLGLIGVNPLEFPGRSAVVGITLAGLGATVFLLVASFAATIWLGLKVSRSTVPFRTTFSALALCVLPIALVYHMAHYLTSFLVSAQYTLAALSDPFGSGADLLGIDPFRVTTGFFNSIDTVRTIWITQAGLVVFGHVWSVFLAHRIALNLFGTTLRAAFATLPLSLFMIGYTFLGLWLLAAPKGM
jgi:hypothetical protein